MKMEKPNLKKEELHHISHNINNPLAVITGVMEIVKMNGGISEEEIELVKKQCFRITNYIRGLKNE